MARNQSFQHTPTKRAHQTYLRSHAIRPEVIYDDYLDIRSNYLDMVRPTPIYRPTPVVRPALVSIDEYDDLILQRELVSVDRQSAPRGRPVVATWYLYSDDLARVPTRVCVPRQQMMSPRSSQTRYQRQTCPQRQEYTQQQARPQKHQQRGLKQNSEGGEGYTEDKTPSETVDSTSLFLPGQCTSNIKIVPRPLFDTDSFFPYAQEHRQRTRAFLSFDNNEQ